MARTCLCDAAMAKFHFLRGQTRAGLGTAPGGLAARSPIEKENANGCRRSPAWSGGTFSPAPETFKSTSTCFLADLGLYMRKHMT